MSNFKSKIKQNNLGALAISYLHCIEGWLMPKFISDEKAVKRYYKHLTGRDLNLNNPKSFSEKLNWYKLNDRKTLMQQCADKVAVRDYVQDCGYENTLNDVYGVYSSINQIDINALPNQFVLKATHGSHMNYIVKDKATFDWKKAKRMIKSWLHQDIYWSGREWVYKDIPHKVVAEKYLEDESGELKDYKFYCFNGKPEYIQLEIGRYGGEHCRNFYDMDWKLQPFGKEIPYNPNIRIEKPLMFEKMVEMATVLSKPFQFVRVDLYQVQQLVIFGELTFFPAGGASDFIPEEYDYIVGEKWLI